MNFIIYFYECCSNIFIKMKRVKIFFVAAIALTLISCGQNNNSANTPVVESAENVQPVIDLKDYGNVPTVLDIESYTLGNDNFRTALWTGTNLQVTLMSIPVGGEIGLELHPDIDQFLRIEEGEGQVMMGDTEEELDFVQTVKADHAIMVPAGKWHNVVNTGKTPIKLYSIYAPVEHPHGTIHKTYAEAMAAEHEH